MRTGRGRDPVGRGSTAPRHRTDARRSAGLVLTALLTATTALALTALGLTLGQPLVSSAPAAAQASVVRRFYAAANARLAGADATVFDSLLAPGFIDHEPDGRSLDRAGFAASLSMLALAAPKVQFDVGTIVVDGAWVAAQATATGAVLPATGGRGDPAPTAPTDFFQLADDRIVAYWPNRALADLPRALPPQPLALAAPPRWLSLARVIYAPGAALAAHDPQLLLLERGRLVVRLSGPARWFAAAHPERGWQTTAPMGSTLTLEAGDALLAPAGADQVQRNPDEAPAAALILSVFPSGFPPGAASAAAAPLAGALAAVQSAHNPARIGEWTAWPNRVWIDILTDWFGGTAPVACLTNPIDLTVIRFPLASGAALPTPPVPSVTLLAREDVWLVGAADGPLATPTMLDGAPKMADLGVGGTTGDLAAISNLSPAPLPLVLFVAAPTAGASCPDGDARSTASRSIP